MKFSSKLILLATLLSLGILFADTIIFEDDFTEEPANWTKISVIGDQEWTHQTYGGNGFMKMSGYSGGNAYANEDWLITPAVDLTNAGNPKLSFETANNYGDENTVLNILISSDFDGNIETANWTDITAQATFPTSHSWTFVASGDIDLSEYSGNIYVAFKYICPDSNAGTWETDNVLIKDSDGENPPVPDNAIVINEIAYNPPNSVGNDNYFEFLEFYNNSSDAVDMSGWTISQAVDFTFPEGSVLDADSYAVVAKNADSLAAYYGITNISGSFEGGLNNSGETVILSDASGNEQDNVTYADGGSWPEEADGQGPSLELIDPSSDNANPDNWQASFTENGTPGMPNSSAPEAENKTIYEIQYTEDESGDSPEAGNRVHTSGIVYAVFDGFFFMSMPEGGAWKGIAVQSDIEVAESDLVECDATVGEVYGRTTLQTLSNVTVSAVYTVISPAVITTGEVASEQYESVLIKVENVTVTNDSLGYGEWEIDDNSGTCRVNDEGDYSYVPQTGDMLDSVTGAVQYSFGNFKIEPRRDDDLIQDTSSPALSVTPNLVEFGMLEIGTEASLNLTFANTGNSDLIIEAITLPSDDFAINERELNLPLTIVAGESYNATLSVTPSEPQRTATSNKKINTREFSFNGTLIIDCDYADIEVPVSYSLETENPILTIHDIQYTEDASGDSPHLGELLTVTGIVSATNYKNNPGNFFMTMPEGGAWNSIYVYNSGDTTLNVGDEISITAEVAEYYNNTQLQAPENGNVEITVLSSGNALPEAIELTTNAVNDEQYESCLVKVNNVTVTEAQNNYGEWKVDDGSGEVQVDDGFFYLDSVDPVIEPAVGMVFVSVTGAVDFSYGEYGINPRDVNDLIQDTSSPALSVTPNPVEFGMLEIGTEASLNLTFANTGNSDLIIEAITLPSDDFAINERDLNLPLTIVAGESYNATLSVTPSAPQRTATRNRRRETRDFEFNGTLIIDCNYANIEVPVSYSLDIDVIPSGIVINEIAYNPPASIGNDEFFEFLELYNNSSDAVDISGWTISDAVNFTFAEGTVLDADSYIVVAHNADSLSAYYELDNVAGSFSGGLNNTGETVILSDASGSEQDNVTYADGGDWPSEADGQGPSLELIDPSSDNANPDNWQISFIENGTPGMPNSSAPEAENKTIYEIQYTEDASGDSPEVGNRVHTSGLVYAVFDGLFFMSMPEEGAWKGIAVQSDLEVAESDLVECDATVVEIYGRTTLQNLSNVTVSPVDMMAQPVLITTETVNTEAYESVLIKVENVTVTDDSLGYGEWEINDGSGTCIVDDHADYSYVPQTGDMISAITGAVQYSYGNFKIEPRRDDDFQFADAALAVSPLPADFGMIEIGEEAVLDMILQNIGGSDLILESVTLPNDDFAINARDLNLPLTVSAGASYNIALSVTPSDPDASRKATRNKRNNMKNLREWIFTGEMIFNGNFSEVTTEVTYSLDLAPAVISIHEIQYTDQASGDSPYLGQTVTTTGLVVATGFSNGADNFYLAMPEGGPWSGIYVYQSGNSDLQTGDEINITAKVDEYYGFTELKNPENASIEIEVLSSGNELPEPIILNTNEANNEEYEACLVKVENVTVTETQNNYGEWKVNDGSGDVQIDDGFFYLDSVDPVIEPAVGMTFSFISGLVDFSFDSYGIHPRSIDDLGNHSDNDDNPELFRTVLDQNFPNPFNPTTLFSFNLKKEGNIELVVYNVKGQEVKVLAKGHHTSGEHKVQWNGDDQNGNKVSSGVYFYRLRTSDQTFVKKALLMK